MEGNLTIHFSCIRRMSVEALTTVFKEACFNQPLETETDMKLEMLATPDKINGKPIEVVEKFLASASEDAIKAQLENMKELDSNGVKVLEQLDARILWAIRKPLKETHPELHKKGSWWWWFVLKYITNNAAFVIVFGLCTILPTVLAFQACKAIYKVKTPAYMDPPVVEKKEGEEEVDEEDDDLRDPEPPVVILNEDEDGDDEMLGPKPLEPTHGLPMGKVLVMFGFLTTLFACVFMALVYFIYHKFIPLCYNDATFKGFHLIPNSPVMIDMSTLSGYVLLYNAILWLNLFMCGTHYTFDSTGEIGAALMGLPVGMIPPDGATEISNDAYYNIMVFSRYLIFTVLALFLLKPLILFWYVSRERFPAKTKITTATKESQ